MQAFSVTVSVYVPTPRVPGVLNASVMVPPPLPLLASLVEAMPCGE